MNGYYVLFIIYIVSYMLVLLFTRKSKFSKTALVLAFVPIVNTILVIAELMLYISRIYNSELDE